jgi:hypothetical protein
MEVDDGEGLSARSLRLRLELLAPDAPEAVAVGDVVEPIAIR